MESDSNMTPPTTTAAHTRYTVQNQCQLVNPVTGQPITGDRIFDGDTVLGEWYDTGNEVMGQRICDALNAPALAAENAKLREALEGFAAIVRELTPSPAFDAQFNDCCLKAVKALSR